MNLCKSSDSAEDFIVLTPNQRLSLATREAYDQQQRLAEKTVWPSLSAFPLQQWAINLSQSLIKHECIPSQLLLNTYQTDLVWQNILSSTDESSLSPFFASTVKAWALSHQWEINIHHPDFLKYEAAEIWQQWALRLESHLQKNDWIDNCLALHQLISSLERIDKKTLSAFLPAHITLLAFTHFTPFEKKFLDLLRKHGVNITETHLGKTPAFCAKRGFEDEEAEFEALAQWAYEKSHTGSVACVIPHLASVKNKIMAIFERYIEDKSLLNISLGNALSTYPLIQAALTGIKLLEDKLSIETLSQFLLSPFYQKSLSEFSHRALLDAKLNAQLSPVIDKSVLLKILDTDSSSDTHFIKCLFEKTISIAIYKSFREWAEFFQAHLVFLGWPGERTLSSEEFQLLSHWNSLIENFASLAVVSGKINFQAAQAKLVELAHHSLFQAKRSPNARIDILGTLEAAGLQFDHVWLAGFQENVWPAKVAPNPFLPLSLQRKLNMPHASADQHLKFHERITQQLFSAAPEIIVSYPKTYHHNPSRPSLLIQTIPEEEIPLPRFPKVAEKQRKLDQVRWNEIEDQKAPRLDIENSPSYGSDIFKDQAACPFRAYAKHRLKAKKMELPQLGFKALTRGNLVHQVLEKFFKLITDHQKLSELSPTDLSIFIDEIIHTILDKIPKDIFTIVEKKRLTQLILSWMAQEKKREPFTVIATEETLKTYFGKLNLNLRIDRIDKINKDEYIIIDYKTGKRDFNPNIHSLDEPQLPLYCVVSALSVKNIAFAQLRTDEMEFRSFPAQKEQWEKALLALAQEYIDGHAAVKPKYGKASCHYCDLTSLCRIKEAY